MPNANPNCKPNPNPNPNPNPEFLNETENNKVSGAAKWQSLSNEQHEVGLHRSKNWDRLLRGHHFGLGRIGRAAERDLERRCLCFVAYGIGCYFAFQLAYSRSGPSQQAWPD